MHEQAPMNDSISEKEKSYLDVFPLTAANSVITDMIPVQVFGFCRVNFLHYRFYDQAYQRISIFLSVMLFSHFSVSESSNSFSKCFL